MQLIKNKTENKFTDSTFKTIGVDISKARTQAEVLKTSHLNYDIVYEDVKVRGKKVSDCYAITRDDTGKVFGIIRNRYTIIQNKDLSELFHEVVSNTNSKYQYAGTLNEGETIWILAKLPEIVTISGNEIGFYIMISNMQDGKHSGQISFIPIRERCKAILTATKRSTPNKITINHNVNFFEQISSEKIITMKDEYVREISKLFQAMAKRKVDDTERDQFFNMIVTDRRQISKNDLSNQSANRIASLTDFYLNHYSMKGLTGSAFGLFASVAGFYQTVKRYDDPEKKFNNILFEGDAIKYTLNAFHFASMLV